MNNRSFLLLSLTAVVFVPAPAALAQTAAPSPVFTRPRLVKVAGQSQTATPAPSPQTNATRQTTDGVQQSPTRTPAAPPSTPSRHLRM